MTEVLPSLVVKRYTFNHRQEFGRFSFLPFFSMGINSLTYCILMDPFNVICWKSPFVILGVSGLFCHSFYLLWKILLTNNVVPNQLPHVLSDLGLHLFAYGPFPGFQVKRVKGKTLLLVEQQIYFSFLN